MKAAIIGDFHGNIHGLNAILEDIEGEKADQIICLGDLISPFPGSLKAWQTIQDLNIPLLRGNHEDYVVDTHLGADKSLIKRSTRFKPVRFAAKLFPLDIIKQIQALPLSLTLNAPDGSKAVICHASPQDNETSIASKINDTMAKSLRSLDANTIIAGHLHKQWHQSWEDKNLYLIGSGGLPLQGNPKVVEYSMLHFKSNQWQVENKKVPYDFQSAIQNVLQSTFIEETGAFGLLFLLELITQQSHFMPMFQTSNLDPWPDEEDTKLWQKIVGEYITRSGLWDELQKFVTQKPF